MAKKTIDKTQPMPAPPPVDEHEEELDEEEDEDEDEHDDDGGDGNGKPAAPKLSAAWAEVARASAVHEDETPPERDVELRIGDVIEHPKFGRCSVERLEGDGEFAHVRLRNARLVRLSLEVLKLTLTVGGPPRVFRASVG